MPLIEGLEVSPDDALKAGKCPECGIDLTKVNPLAHRREHWEVVPRDDRAGQEAKRRIALFDKFLADSQERTSKAQDDQQSDTVQAGKPGDIPV